VFKSTLDVKKEKLPEPIIEEKEDNESKKKEKNKVGTAGRLYSAFFGDTTKKETKSK
jgi:hypothetical protein